MKRPEVIKDIVRRIKAGDVFIYPTDTLYGIGCNAPKAESVERVRKIKGTGKPLSVIAPSPEWIFRNLIVDSPGWLEKLPGPYTLIVWKKKASLLKECSPGPKLGIRIPSHYFTGFVAEAKVPFVTTSANISGQEPGTKLANMPVKLTSKVDVFIDDGEIKGKPSTVVDLTEPQPRVVRA